MSLISRNSFASAVAQANRATKDIVVTIIHSVPPSFDGRGKPTSAPTITNRKALLTVSTQTFRQTDGKELQAKYTILFLENVAVDKSDTLTLPDGTTGPILNIGGLEDPNGGRYFTEVSLG